MPPKNGCELVILLFYLIIVYGDKIFDREFVFAYMIRLDVVLEQSSCGSIALVCIMPYAEQLLVVLRIFVGRQLQIILQQFFVILHIYQVVCGLYLFPIKIGCVKAKELRCLLLLKIAEQLGAVFESIPPSTIKFIRFLTLNN